MKIFGDIWTREDYRSNKYANGTIIENIAKLQINASKQSSINNWMKACSYDSNFLYRRSVVKNTSFTPSGWEIPSSTHYKEIQAMLTKYNLNSGLSFRSNSNLPGHSPLGYEAPNSASDGWIKIIGAAPGNNMVIQYYDGGKENEYWANDGKNVRINDSGFAIETLEEDSFLKDPECFLSVRLIKKN